jgi:HPt (histidine-containing phosphotransfer) domain-containing protein
MLSQIETQLLDQATIEGLRALGGDDDPDFLSDLIADYLADAGTRISEIKRLLKTKDFPKIAKLAHALKGSSYNVGAYQLGDLAKQMDERCTTGNLENVDLLIEQMEKVFGKTSQALLLVQ